MAASKFLSLTGLDTYDAKIKDWVEKKGYTTPDGHNHDGRYYTETEVNNLLKDYLKLTGGTITGTLTINRDASAIHYNNASGTSWGWMGFKAKDTPAVWENTGTTSYNILHAGNSGVSLSGSTLTVKLNGTEHSLTNTTYGAATQSAAGLMTATDKKKLDGIASGANAYSLPLAASGTRGGIQIGYSANGANIPLQLSSEKGYVTLTKTSVTTALGYTPPTTNTTYNAATQSAAGLMSADDKKKLDGIAAGANNYTYTHPTSDASGTKGATANVTGTEGQTIKVPKITVDSLGHVTGLSEYTYTSKNTTYSDATQSAAGLMTANDKKKLDGIASGANAYTHPSTHPASIITGLATVATSGSYNDLSNKPTIPTSLPANGGNADTVDNKHASDFMAAGDTSHGTHVTSGNQTWSGNKTFTGYINISGTDLNLNTSGSTSNDSGDIVFTYGNGNEKCRIYTANEPNNGNGPHYRVKKTDGTTLYDGRLATVADIPGAATQSAAGLMSAADKKKLDGIASGANNYTYTHPATHPASIITGLATVAKSGSYNDLSNKPTIPTALPANGGNADTVDNKHASDFMAAGDTSHGTHVTTGAQTWSGTKTFSSEVILNGGGTQTDICSGIAAAFKTKRIMANQIIADSIILGASSGSASNKNLTIQKYGKITSTAPDSLTTLLTFDTKGRIRRTSGGSWISARDNTIIMQEQTSNSGSSYNPIIGTKTQAGFWSMGSCGGETLYLSYDTDENYNAGNNTSSTILFPTAGRTGTIALTADIPGNATQSAAGLMSAADKKKLDGIDLSGGIELPDGNDGSLQEALNALKTLIAGKADSSHNHDASNINTGTLDAARIPNLAAGKITSGTFDAARIPSLAASKITSGTFDIGRIPTGTSAGSVALGNHGHSGYAGATHTHAAGEITSGTFAAARIPSLAASKITSGTFDAARIPDLAASKITSGTFDIARIPTGTSAGSVSLGNHSHSGYATTNHGTHITDDDQEWSGVKTFVNGIRIGDDSDPSGNTWESDRTIYFGDGEYAAIYESPSDALSLKGSVINVNTNTTHSDVTIPSIDGYSQSSTSSWSSSSRMTSTYNVTTGYTNMKTRSATSSYSLQLYISGSSTYASYSVGPGQTIRIDVGASFTSYVNTREVSVGGSYCSNCDSYIDYVECVPAYGWMPYMYVNFYLTTSSSSTTPISGTSTDISMPWYQGYNSNYYGTGSTTTPSVQTYIEYTNTGTGYATVYLRGKIYRNASSSTTCSGVTSGNWLFVRDSSYDYFPRCTNCGSTFNNLNTNTINNYNPGTFYHYFGNITTFRKYITYTKNTFVFPAINKFNSKNAFINNGIINNYSNLFTGTGVTYTSSGFINSNKQLCYKFPDANSVFYADKDKLSYIIGGISDITKNKPSLFLNIDNRNGLQLMQDYCYQQLNDGTLKLQYSSTILTIDDDSIISNVTNDLEIGSSSCKCYRIYSNYFYGTVSSSSDERFKEWQSDIEIDFDKLKTIPKKIFKWKDSFLKPDDNLHIGTSAQAIRDIYPEIVHIYNEDKELWGPKDIYDPDAVLTVDYDKLGVIALAAIDKLHEENVLLKEENEKLKEESEQLKTRLDNLEAILKEKGIL